MSLDTEVWVGCEVEIDFSSEKGKSLARLATAKGRWYLITRTEFVQHVGKETGKVLADAAKQYRQAHTVSYYDPLEEAYSADDFPRFLEQHNKVAYLDK